MRSVAQLELPALTIRSCSTQWQRTAIRSISSSRRSQHAPFESNQNPVRSPGHIPFEGPQADAAKPQYGSQDWAKGVVEGSIAMDAENIQPGQHTQIAEAGNKQAAGGDSKFMRAGISSRVLSRRLRKERRKAASSRRHLDENKVDGESASVKSEITPMRRPNGKYRERVLGNEIKPTIRIIGAKKKVYDSGFKIHYSAPSAAVSARPSKEVTAPKAKLLDSAKEKQKKEEEDEWIPPAREHWQIDKDALKAKFPDGWKPLRRLSPDALAGIRALHAQDPAQYTTAVLANSFEVSPEAMRRILKGKWSPNAEEESDRLRRWNNRGKSVYSRYVELGVLKPPKKWRALGIGKGKPDWMVNKQNERRARMDIGEAPLPALVTMGRVRHENDGSTDTGRGLRREKTHLPALITTRRLEDAASREERLEDRIL